MNSKSIVVIGCGNWGKNLIRCFHSLGRLKGIYDDDMDKAKSFESQYADIKIYESLQNVFWDDEVEAVVIAVPVEHHFAVAKEALAFKKHIFVEKPVTSTSQEAAELLELAKSADKVFQVGHLLEYHPAVIKLRSMIKDGVIGEIKEVYSHRLNAGKVRQFENVWWSFAPHDVLLILNTVKANPTEVKCFMSDYLKRGVADSTMTMFNFGNECFGHIYVSWLHPYKLQSFVVIGTEGAIEFTDSRSEEKLKLYPNKYGLDNGEAVLTKGDYEVVDFPKDEPLLAECQAFVDCITEHKVPVSSGREGLMVLEVLEQAVKSAESA